MAEHTPHSTPTEGTPEVHASHVIPVYVYYRVFAALVVLMVATVVAAIPDMGGFDLAIAMLIAVIKTALVLIYFMHLKVSSRLVQFFSVAALIWLGILFVFTMNDYLTRDSPEMQRILVTPQLPPDGP